MDINIIEEIKKVIKIELRGLNTLLKMINSDYEKALLQLFHCKGNIVFIGIGKSGLWRLGSLYSWKVISYYI